MSSTDNDGIWRPAAPFDKNEIQWPLSYSLRPPLEGAQPRKYWSHTYYRGPGNQSVRILYSADRHHSEVIAQGFLNEPVLGFDMEWPWEADRSTRLQDKVALIQIACERKIGLFHIARHDGNTTDELIAPALRRIIESAIILKTGVAILNADFARLKKFFQLEPRGALELSHLDKLVKFGLQKPDRVTVRLRALSKLTEDHLGLPLFKGSVRTSDWRLPLDDSQKTYAADDAYVGYMLFHCMNALRLNMTPTPPLPKLAESYLPFTLPRVALVQLEPVADRPEASVLTARDFFFPPKPLHLDVNEVTGESSEKVEAHSLQIPDNIQLKGSDKEERKFTTNASNEPEPYHEIYNKLVSHRRQLAKAKGISAFIIAPNKLLETLSKHRPTNKEDLSAINGVSKNRLSLYGDDWLRIISEGLEGRPKESPKKTRTPLQPKTPNKIIAIEDDNQKSLDKGLPDPSDELYQQLDEHRKALSAIQGCRPYIITTNLVLQALAQRRPTNNDELLAIEGIGKREVAAYGPAWLWIITGFKADHEPKPVQPAILEKPAMSHPEDFFKQPLPQVDEQPPQRKRIKHVGRSKELVMTGPVASTGLSFEFSKTNLHIDEAPAEMDDVICCDESDNLVSKSPVRPPVSPQLKRKRVECSNSPCEKMNTADTPINPTPTPGPSEAPHLAPIDEVAQPESLTPQQTILRKKLDAYVKSVVWLMKPKPAQPIVSEDTLQCLVATLPRTLDEFHHVPGIEGFLQTCQGVKKDLWLAFSTWTRTAGLVPSP
ncbi:hypothetical protein F4805DRAFT_449732 [Annulohypoxylon moriforme]|nr:hypothetical protein F4805DRAFT_449732 [Annulohypoxylon moriforme]